MIHDATTTLANGNTTPATSHKPQMRVPEKSVQGTIGTYFKLLKNMGIRSGTRIFIQLLLKSTDRLRLPGIQHPISLRKGTSDVFAFDQVFLYNEYAFHFNGEPRVIIDGGANIGMFTVFTKNRFPDAKIICIEPDEENFRQLQKNVQRYDNVHCENSGLWHGAGKLKVWDKYDLGKWAMVVEESELNWNVNALSLTTIMEKYNIDVIDVLKLDIESSEKEVFAKNFEPWLAKTKMIIIELHDSMKEGCAKQFFKTVNTVFSDYELSIKGENIILVNKNIIHT